MFKVTLITLFLHSDTKFELQQDVLTISTSLNACCVELLPLSDYKFALMCSWTGVPEKVISECIYSKAGWYTGVITVTKVCQDMDYVIPSYTIIKPTSFGFSAHMKLYLPQQI